MHDGSVYGCGSNSRGQLVEMSKEETIFKMICSLSKYKIKQLATKWETSYAISIDGECLAWGPNNYGQQGHPKTDKQSTNEVHVVSSRVKQVAAGLRHVVILKHDGSVFSAGDRKKGQLGRSRGSEGLEKVPNLENVVQIACGQNHNIALTDEGKLFGWGCNKFGQLAIENQEIVNQPTFICDVSSTKCKLLCGWTHSAYLDDKGKLTNWGRNKYSQLGVPQMPFKREPQLFNFAPFRQVEFGSEHCLGITVDGEVVSWGWNEHGNCGTGGTADVSHPTFLNIGAAFKVGAGAGQSFAAFM